MSLQMNSFVLFLLLSLIVLSYHVHAQNGRYLRAKHGEHCNTTVRCDTASFMTCSNSVCECLKPDTMFYDPAIKSCLTLVGEKCKYQLRKNMDDSGEIMENQSQSLLQELDCVQNAWCNRSGFCMCADDYVELRNGTCITVRNVGETCSTDMECRRDQFLICVNGLCGCNETVATYNILIRQCVGKAGKPCLGSAGGCVYSAECLDNSASYLGFTKRRMRQSMTVCTCSPGFVADDSGFCRVGLEGKCSNAKICANGLKCKDGRCECPFKNVQQAQLRTQTCISLVGGPCNETIILNETSTAASSYSTIVSPTVVVQRQTFPCVENAYCALTNNDSLYECHCGEGFVENNDRTCDLAYGSSCGGNSLMSASDGDSAENKSEQTWASWNQNLSCDRAAPLFCIDGKCQCESYLYEYDSTSATCLGKFGAPCVIGKRQILRNNVTLNGCIYGAECISSNMDMLSSYGRCSCSAGFTVTTNRTCLKS